MMSTLPYSSAFLAMPPEIRQLVYLLCIPENLCMDCSDTMYFQNRHIKPLWSLDRTLDRYDTSEAYFPENDHPRDDRESVFVYSTDGEDSEDEPSGLDDYCQISQRYPPRFSSSHRSALPGLLLVCHQITDEVMAMLYGGNFFKVNIQSDGQLNFMRLFSSETREKMRKMILVFRSNRPDFCMDPKIWDGVLGRLSILGVIAVQPMPPPKVEPEDVKKWTAWLTQILEYLGQALPRAAQIVVDANEKGDTVHILEKVMPGRCRFQRLRMADSIFRRGVFSPEWGDDGPTSCRDIISDRDYDYYYSD